MGRKVHPIGIRLGINTMWQGRWFAEGNQYREQLQQDMDIRHLLMGKTSKGGSAWNGQVRKLRREGRNGERGMHALLRLEGTNPEVDRRR